MSAEGWETTLDFANAFTLVFSLRQIPALFLVLTPLVEDDDPCLAHPSQL